VTDETTPTLAEIIRVAMAAERMGIRTWLPGRIVSYDGTTQRAEVELQIKQWVPTTSGGRRFEEIPHLYDVPVGHPRGGGYFVHFPMLAGDFVSVAFSAQSLGEFLRTGQVSEPQDPRMHGLFPYATPTSDPSEPNQLADMPAGKLVIGREDGKVLVIDEDGIKLGAEDAAEAMVLGTTLKAHLDAVATWQATLKGIFDAWVPVSMDGGAALKTALAALGAAPTVPAIESSVHALDE
jgi:hypothetical protein